LKFQARIYWLKLQARIYWLKFQARIYWLKFQARIYWSKQWAAALLAQDILRVFVRESVRKCIEGSVLQRKLLTFVVVVVTLFKTVIFD
jgi:hypothetical protein